MAWWPELPPGQLTPSHAGSWPEAAGGQACVLCVSQAYQPLPALLLPPQWLGLGQGIAGHLYHGLPIARVRPPSQAYATPTVGFPTRPDPPRRCWSMFCLQIRVDSTFKMPQQLLEVMQHNAGYQMMIEDSVRIRL